MLGPKGPFVVRALCRGEGVGYVLLGSAVAELESVSAATAEQMHVPVSCYEVDSAWQRKVLGIGDAHAWVVTLPLLSCGCELSLCDSAGRVQTKTVEPLRFKVRSRLLTRTRPQAAACLRGYERVRGQGCTQIHIREMWPGYGATSVARVQVAYPTDDAQADPWLEVYDDEARPLEADLVLMEDHVVPNRRVPEMSERLVTFSCTLPADTVSFYVRSGLRGTKDGRDYVGFDGMNAARAEGWLSMARKRMEGPQADDRCGQWLEGARATEAELAWQRSACAVLAPAEKPLMSVVMAWDTGASAKPHASLQSLAGQTWDAWELVLVVPEGAGARALRAADAAGCGGTLILEAQTGDVHEALPQALMQAKGDYMVFLDPATRLEPDALWCIAQQTRQHPRADLLYTDEDLLIDGSGHSLSFKAFPNYGKLYSHNYVGNLMAVSADVARAYAYADDTVEQAFAYDMTLRAFELAREIVPVQRVLCHSEATELRGPFARGGREEHEAGRLALSRHLGRRQLAAQIEDGPLAGTYRPRFSLPDPLPKLSIVIPTRDHAGLLSTCVRSILDRSTYPNYELVLVENYSADPQTFALYAQLTLQSDKVRVVTWDKGEPGGFNYSALVNFGAAHATGDYLLLLNNDTEVIEATWMEELLACLMRPEVAVAGAKLLFGDGLIQHVGMVATPSGDNCHVCQNFTKDEPGPDYAALLPGDYAMVTGACQLVSRALFDELGGYDEDLAVGFNDSDFCLRAYEAGYVCTVSPYALLHHREFSSRGRESADTRLRERYMAEKATYIAHHAAHFAQGDPVLNPNLDPWSGYFGLRS